MFIAHNIYICAISAKNITMKSKVEVFFYFQIRKFNVCGEYACWEKYLIVFLFCGFENTRFQLYKINPRTLGARGL